MAWHVTPIENVQAILNGGLQPGIGDRSGKVGEAAPGVHLFGSFNDLRSAEWLWDEFEEDAKLALFHVAVPSQEGAWTELAEGVPPEKVTLLSFDAGNIANPEVIAALAALDTVTDPLSDIDSFRRTRVEMKARSFGELVGDLGWEDDGEADFLVYAAGYWIEALHDGRKMLVLENHSWITGEGETLESLEEMLFDFVVSERRPLREMADEARPEF